ncbi:MAG TPA: sigma-70 family RNA polymerase sigma factor [Armatimonadota bacterium]|nr:sigma-70 family RNA polymerase sigma factor [Armatimonadota bacterium]
MPETDMVLVGRVRRGDLNAYGAIIARHQGRLHAAARHLLGEEEAARDAVQETFIEAYRHLDQLRDPSRLGSWLYGILRHRAFAWLASRRPTVSWDEEGAEEWYRADGPEERMDPTALLARLPDDDRDVLAARYLLELSYDEIAALLKISNQAARVRVCRAKGRLRALLAGAEKEVEP